MKIEYRDFKLEIGWLGGFASIIITKLLIEGALYMTYGDKIIEAKLALG